MDNRRVGIVRIVNHEEGIVPIEEHVIRVHSGPGDKGPWYEIGYLRFPLLKISVDFVSNGQFDLGLGGAANEQIVQAHAADMYGHVWTTVSEGPYPHGLHLAEARLSIRAVSDRMGYIEVIFTQNNS